jgi:hypothetical protein
MAFATRLVAIERTLGKYSAHSHLRAVSLWTNWVHASGCRTYPLIQYTGTLLGLSERRTPSLVHLPRNNSQPAACSDGVCGAQAEREYVTLDPKKITCSSCGERAKAWTLPRAG